MSQGAIHNNLYINSPRLNEQSHIRLENIYDLLNKDEYYINLWFSAPGIEKYIELNNIYKFEIISKNPYNNGQELSYLRNGPIFIRCTSKKILH